MGIDRGRLRARPFLHPLRHVFLLRLGTRSTRVRLSRLLGKRHIANVMSPDASGKADQARSHADAGAPEHGGMTLSGEPYGSITPNGPPGSRERFPAWFDDHHTSR